MNEKDVSILADQALKKVANQIRDDQWSMIMPSDFVMKKVDHPVTLRDIINYHAYDDAWVPDMLAGKTMDEVGIETHKGDLLNVDPKGNFNVIVDASIAAADAFPAEELDSRIVHCSFGDYSARVYFIQINSFRAFRAYDIAKVIGVDPHLSDELVQGLWDELTPYVEEWRAIGVFGPRIDVPDSASLQDRLFGLVGRQPQ